MRSKLLLGGLLASVMIVPALAQSNPPASANPPAATATAPAPASVSQSAAWRSSKLIGLNVYNDQNEKLGDISEILFDKSGKVEGIVIGVGGFLGMGQHDIKVDMAKLKFVDEPVRTSATTHHDHHGCGQSQSPGGNHHHHDDALEVVSGSCDPEWRYEGSAQEHAAVQVRLSGVKSKEKPRFCRGFFFTISVASIAGAHSVFSAGNAGQEPRSSARRTGTRHSGPSPWHSSPLCGSLTRAGFFS